MNCNRSEEEDESGDSVASAKHEDDHDGCDAALMGV